ncbi:carbohydrate ABC transporter membrane protein 1 (CUT1 family) [Ensifer sp. SEMIA 135]|uniref:carbohydrate ABC transporter permease n=1 Tax=Rhizobium meliloti TaxID=382 RepID=UPI000FD976D7|nr:sugar ABC transporter permease [Sinorhizobium meliloti]RVL21096.1 sugar ABC transporter permease [Sinorhizobium meliloti]RVP94606.1 sugar ABC transporter permease [Sinorhizobium meliloti]TWA88509.1 carbohydrate ABC transporter membrane protein 1 (CUT1 family) [Ensifer sp. SEMIA 134]TWB24043.1 carbohydrate ABC transporter membrane protein 1 (CUT1 family) [Ensifer sp. SEMIA 135]
MSRPLALSGASDEPSATSGVRPLTSPEVSAARKRAILEALAAWSLAGPALVLLVILFFLPVLTVFGIALTDWQFGAGSLSSVGLGNFHEVFADEGFRASLVNTLLYVALVVPGTILLGLAIALLIESSRSCRAFYRAIHFLPFMATLTAMAIAWEALLHPTIGLVNQTLVSLGLPTANWLRDESTVLPVLAVIGIWQNLGYAMVLFLAGLKAIPQDLYDAADTDGADLWLDRLRTVTLPMLGPVSMFVFIVVALRAFETFDAVQILTQGGPGHASEMLLFTVYRESFQYLRTGYGAAVAVVFLGIVVALTLIQARVMDKKVHYQ